jgi:predicted RNA-binding Zn-ribbon protein involved in translation (DUF1610 family)
MRPGDWYCPICKELMFANKRVCLKCKVDKHGVSQNLTQKYGDWNCPRCNDIQFSRNTLCRKCGCPKNSIIQDTDKSFVKSGDWNCPNCSDLQFARNKICRKCKTPKPINQYLTKYKKENKNDFDNNLIQQQLKALQEQMNKMSSSYEKTKNEDFNDVIDDDDNLCSICLTNNKNTLLLHSNGNEGHLCCCEDCGKILMQGTKTCPMCRTPITNAIRAF